MTPPPIIGLTDQQKIDAVLRAAEPIDPRAAAPICTRRSTRAAGAACLRLPTRLRRDRAHERSPTERPLSGAVLDIQDAEITHGRAAGAWLWVVLKQRPSPGARAQYSRRKFTAQIAS